MIHLEITCVLIEIKEFVNKLLNCLLRKNKKELILKNQANALNDKNESIQTIFDYSIRLFKH